MDQKIVVLHGFTPEEAFAAMKAVKACGAGAENAAFAATTETNLSWKLEYLIEHVTEEHRQFQETRKKGRNPPN